MYVIYNLISLVQYRQDNNHLDYDDVALVTYNSNDNSSSKTQAIHRQANHKVSPSDSAASSGFPTISTSNVLGSS